MDDLISRAAAITGIGELIREYREKGEDATADGLILSRRYVVKTLPAVDAVPVVRCGDCKHRPIDNRGRAYVLEMGWDIEVFEQKLLRWYKRLVEVNGDA